MMADEATRRSIDEIIGSIRSIMDRGSGGDANDNVPRDLADLPPQGAERGGFAEPMARPLDLATGDLADLPPFAPRQLAEAADQAQLAEIARTVNGNIHADDALTIDAHENECFGEAADDTTMVDEPMPDERLADRELAVEHEAGEQVIDEQVADEQVADHRGATFGRRPHDVNAGPPRTMVEMAVHERLAALHETVAERTVTARGLTVEAANDARPAASEIPSQPLPAVIVPPSSKAEEPFLDEAFMRPIVKDWLDDNLPPIVERLVREELQKAIHGPKGR